MADPKPAPLPPSCVPRFIEGAGWFCRDCGEPAPAPREAAPPDPLTSLTREQVKALVDRHAPHVGATQPHHYLALITALTEAASLAKGGTRG